MFFVDFGEIFANLSDLEWTLGGFWWIWVQKDAWRGSGRPKSRLGGSRGHPRGQKVDFAHGLGSPKVIITGDQEQKSKVQGMRQSVGRVRNSVGWGGPGGGVRELPEGGGGGKLP